MIFKFTFNAGLRSSSAQLLQRRYSSKARASPWRCATSTQMRLAGPFKRRRPRRSTRLRLPWSICGELIRMMPSRQLVPPDTSFGFTSKDDHLPDIISIFSCLFLPPLETGNLPKREATLLDSETRRSFSSPGRRFAFLLPAVDLRESRPAGLPPRPTLRQFRQSLAFARHTSA